MARRVRSYGSALYAWANGRELVTHNPFAAVKPETRETQRDRVLTDAELGDIWRASGKIGWPWGPYVRFLLLTMQREAETAGLEWIELAPDRATWAMPGARTKNNRPHVVHLAAPAQAILKAAPRIAGSHLVFTTTGRTPISGFSKAKTTLDAAIVAERARRAAEDGTEPAPLIPWRWHNFRRSGVTVLARLGVRCEVADKVLNHVAGGNSWRGGGVSAP
jgi:integrase